MPILGIMASQISGHLWAPEGAYDALATVTVPSGGVATIDFVGIPTGYKHLQLRGIVKSTGGGTEDFRMQYNGNTSAYAVHALYGNGSSAAANAGTSQTAIVGPYNVVPYSGATSIFGAIVIDVLDYSSTNKLKTVRILGGQDSNGSGNIGLYSGFHTTDTTAITSIKLFATSNNLAQYSQFALYGVK